MSLLDHVKQTGSQFIDALSKLQTSRDVQTGINLVAGVSLCFPVTRPLGYAIYFANNAINNAAESRSLLNRFISTIGVSDNKEAVLRISMIAVSVLGFVGAVASLPHLVIASLAATTFLYIAKAVTTSANAAQNNRNLLLTEKQSIIKNLGHSLVSTALFMLNIPTLAPLSPVIGVVGAVTHLFSDKIVRQIA